MSGFRLGVRDGRAVLIDNGRSIDVANRSAGRFGEDVMALYRVWDIFAPWAGEQQANDDDPSVEDVDLGLCVPRPRNVFAIVVNYRDHIVETGRPVPEFPTLFAKFADTLTGPVDDIVVRDTDRPDAFWCPMHPDVRSPDAETCHLCGMALVPIPPPKLPP